MKQDPMMKLYKNTNPEALAALAVGASMRNDEVELGQVLSSVPIKHYTCPDVRYLNRSRSLMDIFLLWGMLYWQAWARHLMLSREIVAEGDTMSMPKLLTMDVASKHYESQINILNRAIDIFAKETGLDTNTVRQWSGVFPQNKYLLSAEEDICVDELVKSWEGML